MGNKEAEGRKLGIEITMSANRIGRYERELERYNHKGWWRDLIRLAERGQFDDELFRDMASFAFVDFKAHAEEGAVPRGLVYLAFAMKEFAEMEAEVSDEFKAAQMVAEAIYKQGCYGWQRVDGEILRHQLVVLVGEEGRVLVNMRTVDLAPLMETADERE